MRDFAKGCAVGAVVVSIYLWPEVWFAPMEWSPISLVGVAAILAAATHLFRSTS